MTPRRAGDHDLVRQAADILETGMAHADDDLAPLCAAHDTIDDRQRFLGG